MTGPQIPVPDPLPLAELAARLATLDSRDGAVPGELAPWRELLELVALRRRLPPDAPLLTVLVGPTGAGKSTVLNLTLGRTVSPAGPVRPCTRRPLAVARGAAAERLAADPWLGTVELGLEWVTDGDLPAALEQQVLIDTPDFDSIEAENRTRARRLLLRADRVVLVLNPEKYGDAAVEEILACVARLGGAAACVFNKFESPGALEDCARRLAELNLPAPLALPRVATPDDPASHDPETLTALREAVLPPPTADDVLARRRAAAETLEHDVRSTAIEPWVAGLQQSLTHLQATVDDLERDLPARLERSIPLKLDDAVRRGLIQRFEAQVKRFDVTRRIRGWGRDLFRWVGLGGKRADTPAADPATVPGWLADAHGARFLDLVGELTAELRARVHVASGQVSPPFPWSLPAEPHADTARADLEQVFRVLCDEIARESERIAEGLSAGSKFTFYGAQVAAHSALLYLFIQTGGLTGAEIVGQSFAVPLLAALAEKLVSSGEIAAVEKRLAEILNRELVAAVRPYLQPVVDDAAAVAAVVPDPKTWQRAVDELEGGAA